MSAAAVIRGILWSLAAAFQRRLGCLSFGKAGLPQNHHYHLEAIQPASSAASGGEFLVARGWGDGLPQKFLHNCRLTCTRNSLPKCSAHLITNCPHLVGSSWNFWVRQRQESNPECSQYASLVGPDGAVGRVSPHGIW
jgi:hypothetical protein